MDKEVTENVLKSSQYRWSHLAVSLHSCISRNSFPNNKFIKFIYFGSSSLQRGSIWWAFSLTHSLFLKIIKLSFCLFNTLKNPNIFILMLLFLLFKTGFCCLVQAVLNSFCRPDWFWFRDLPAFSSVLRLNNAPPHSHTIFLMTKAKLCLVRFSFIFNFYLFSRISLNKHCYFFLSLDYKNPVQNLELKSHRRYSSLVICLLPFFLYFRLTLNSHVPEDMDELFIFHSVTSV